MSFLKINPSKDFCQEFLTIAEQLLNNYILRINGYSYYIAEIEFYLNSDKHPDIFSHSTDDQLTCSQWCFHKTGESYRGGNYKGLDISFGKKSYGGILIRAIKSCHKDAYIEGPCNVVNHILTLSEVENIPELITSEHFHRNIFKKGLIYLKPTKRMNLTIYSSARIGLNLRNKHQVPYVIQPYRFLTCPSYVRKGRQHLVLELYYQGYKLKQIQKIVNYTQCLKWIQYYDIGFEGDTTAKKYFNKKMNVNEFSEFYGAMKRINNQDCLY